MARDYTKPYNPIKIDWNEFDKLCALHCTLIEIAGWFDCSEDTIENRVKETHGVTFSEYYKQKSGKGKVSLRRRQWNLAEKNVAMAIFLGKQYLGQSDKTESTVQNIEMKIDDQDRNL